MYNMDFALSVIDVNRHTWHQCENLIKPIPHDIYFSPEYLTLFDGKDEAVTDRFGKNPKMIVYGNEDNYIVHPVLLKPINSLPFYQVQNRDDDTILYDLVSPWYYGGPLICLQEESTKKHLLDGFFSEFTGYCKEHNFISEFVRLHPLLKNYQAVGGYVNAESKSQIVYVDLMQDLDTIWNNYKQENRKAINRAQRRGVEIEISKRPEDIKTFFELYTKSMDRLNADKVYYFSMDFFNNLFSTLGEHAHFFPRVMKDRSFHHHCLSEWGIMPMIISVHLILIIPLLFLIILSSITRYYGQKIMDIKYSHFKGGDPEMMAFFGSN